MADLKWSRRHENVNQFNTIDQIINTVKENYIMLPEEAKMTEAIEAYIY